jgi:hypothetical protein
MGNRNFPSEAVLPSAFRKPEESLTLASAIGAPPAFRSTPLQAPWGEICPAAITDAARTMRAREQKYFRPTPEPAIATEQNRFGFTGLPYMCDMLCAAGSLQSLPTELSRIISLNALLKPFCSGSDAFLVKMVPQRYALADI